MEQVFQALIDRSRAPLDLKTIRTILGNRHPPRYRKPNKQSAQWEVAVERPLYDLTIFKLHCGKLTLRIYTKGERVLRFEAIAHNTQELGCGRSLEKFPEIVLRLKAMLERFLEALSCIHRCFIADDLLERLPAASQVGKTKVGRNRSQPAAHAPGRRSADCFVGVSLRLHRLRAGGSGSRTRQTDPIAVRSPPRRLRPEQTPWQTNRPPDRPDTPLRADPNRSESDDRAASPYKQRNQTSARGRSGT